MRQDFRQCAAAGAFNTGVTPCPLQPDKVSGVILVTHGQKLPAELTVESLMEACHADYPGRIYPILGVEEYAVNGGEANTSATGYGANKITGYSARTDSFTLGKYNMSLKACVTRAKSTQLDMYVFDYNNVIYGMDDGTDVLAGIPLSGIYITGQEFTSSSQAAQMIFNAMLSDVEKYMMNASVRTANFDISSALKGLVFVEFVKQTGGENKYKLIEHFERLDMTPYYGELLRTAATEVLDPSTITAVQYDAAAGVLTMTGEGTPTLKSPSVLYENDITGIEQWS